MSNPPLNIHTGRQTAQKGLSVLTVLVICITALTTGLVAPPKTFAWTGELPGCTQYMASWQGDLKASVESRDANFSYATSSYAYVRSGAAHDASINYPNPPNTHNQMEIYYVNAPNKLVFRKNGTTYDLTTEAGTALSKIIIYSAEVKSGQSDYTQHNGTQSVPTQIGCISGATNVMYNASWDVPQYQSVEYGGSGATACGTTDIACKVSRVFRGVADTFHAVGQAILRGIAALFAPDSASLNATYTDFKDFMHLKMGFLLYPFEFIASTFGAFNDTSNQWCNSNSCSKNFGNVYGSNFTMDILQWRATAPTLYTFLVGALRGLTVVALIFSLHRKYLEVIKK